MGFATKVAGAMALLQNVAPVAAAPIPDLDIAPFAKSAIAASDPLLMNPNELKAAAPLTWQTLQRIPAMSDLPNPVRHAAPVVVTEAPLSSFMAEEGSHEDTVEHIRAPVASLVSEVASAQKPRFLRHAREADTLGEPGRYRPAHRSFASMEKSAAGSTASLDEDGYQAVAALRNSRAMWFFIRRVVEANNAEVTDEGKFNGLVPFYSGEASIQSFARLNEELFQSPTGQGMVKMSRRHSRRASASVDTDLTEVYERTHRMLRDASRREQLA